MHLIVLQELSVQMVMKFAVAALLDIIVTKSIDTSAQLLLTSAPWTKSVSNVLLVDIQVNQKDPEKLTVSNVRKESIQIQWVQHPARNVPKQNTVISMVRRRFISLF